MRNPYGLLSISIGGEGAGQGSQLFAGAVVAATLTMKAVLTGALTDAIEGVGLLLSTGQESADTATVLAMVPLLWSFYELFEALRRRMEARFAEG
ncbi:hypothetical protein KUG85_07265 [Nitratireductor sp. L1-7-SE]|uniref:Uncharacterized protein n=1 Tax=Nitratireductor rhodophyticola TaxID=2854036 RepID=A0ABS7RAP7_9HYPH|nr:hypothetical protein [Nitratireductor rhodophyticola]MBY8917076.1 hypothetical protein [Nitratireductor rhodophyticola]MBY8920495.1 hypothetical protein [Nitratireductor rhodophyticola]